VTERRVDLVRLTDVPLEAVQTLLNEPRLRRHMPLSSDMSREETAAWVRDKDSQWERNGYGPWAVLLDGEFAGWAGFQAEPTGADFALVLLPQHWGSGLAVARRALDRGFGELGLTEVLISLPFSRSPDRVVARLGFVPTGVTEHGELTFREYRLAREVWEERGRA
jgi:ribosomal-protein-alanine N-acetyltransferase